MAKKQKLEQAVLFYIEAKKRLTSCMQNHFKQVCHTCKEYAKCSIYNEYVEAWMQLQNSYKDQLNKSNSNSGKYKEYDHSSFPYLAAELLLELVLENHPNYDKKRLLDKKTGEAYREKKLQEGSRDVDLMMRIDGRPAEEIIRIIEWAQADDFWWQNVRSPGKLRKQYETLLIKVDGIKGRNTGAHHEELIEDFNPDLTNKLISSLQRWGIVKKDFNPNSKQINQIRLTVQKMIKFYKNRICKDEKIWLEDLFDCLNQNYLGKGNVVHIGTLCSDQLWDMLMPQLLRICGEV